MADEKKEISVREWQNKYRAGEFNNPSFETMCAAGWYDWFCSDRSLLGRLKKLAPLVMAITDPNILDNYYVWFKNNCPTVATSCSPARTNVKTTCGRCTPSGTGLISPKPVSTTCGMLPPI